MFNLHFNVDSMAHKLIASLAIFCSLTTFIHAAQAAEGVTPIPKVSDGWRVSVSPYVWIPQVNTTVSAGGGGSKNADISMNSLINNLKTGAMIAGEVHNGKWGLIGDLATATLQKSGGFNFKGDPQYRAGDKSTLQATLASLAGTYTVLNNSDIYMESHNYLRFDEGRGSSASECLIGDASNLWNRWLKWQIPHHGFELVYPRLRRRRKCWRV
jgi:hypothetical protein